MPNIYTFHRPFAKYQNVHSLIRNVFEADSENSQNTLRIAGYESQELYRVLSPTEPNTDEGLVGSMPVKEHLAKEGTVVSIDCVVAFSNRGRKIPDDKAPKYREYLHKQGIVKSKDPTYMLKPLEEQKEYSDSYKIPQKLTANGALHKFMAMTGLREVDTAAITHKEKPNAQFLGPRKLPKFVVYNGFAISGLFVVEDKELFLKCLREGVGSRRTYGFGILFAEPASLCDTESDDTEYEEFAFV